MFALLPLLFLLASCSQPAPEQPATPPAPVSSQFPHPHRPVASIAAPTWSDETNRDNKGEASQVIEALKISPGMHIADIGSGSGYYSVRLAPVVGPNGRIYANDIIPDYLGRLKRRAQEMGLNNIEVFLGDNGNANLPRSSIDLALMVHMYHEIAEPFSLLWHLHESLKPGGKVAIIDADRAIERHGTPVRLLRCELAANGYRHLSTQKLGGGNYLSLFEAGKRPDPQNIKPCDATRTDAAT